MKHTAMLAATTALILPASFASGKAADKPTGLPAGNDPTTTDDKPAKSTNRHTGPRTAPEITTARADVTMPSRNARRGSDSIYPFASLTSVGMSFGVKNKSRANMNSIVHNQNKKHLIDATDGNGAKIGKMINVNGIDQRSTTEFEQTATKRFFAQDVDPSTDPDGASVRIFRDI